MRTDSAPRSGTSPVVREATAPPIDATAPPHPLQAGPPLSPPLPASDAMPATIGPAVPPGLDAPPVPPASPPGDVPAPVAVVAMGAPPRAARRPFSRRARLYLALGIALLAVTFLAVVRSVLEPFVWAAVVAYILNPVVRQVQRRLRLRHGFAVALVALALVGFNAWMVALAVGTVRGDVVALTGSLSVLNNFATTYLPNAGTLTILGIQVQSAQLVHNAQAAILDAPRLLLHGGWGVAAGTVETLLRLLTFLLSTIYLLFDASRLREWARARVPAAYRDDATELGREINRVLSEYLRAEVILILIMSTASLIVLSVMGVRFAMVLAPIVGFLEIFPIIGPFFAIALVSVVALIGPGGFGLRQPGFALVVALIFFVMRQIEDYLVIPNVVGHAVKLHPVLILFALLCGATLGGILGMFLAVPVTGALKVLGSYTYDRLVE